MGYGVVGDAHNDIHEVVLGLLQLTNQNRSGKIKLMKIAYQSIEQNVDYLKPIIGGYGMAQNFIENFFCR